MLQTQFHYLLDKLPTNILKTSRVILGQIFLESIEKSTHKVNF